MNSRRILNDLEECAFNSSCTVPTRACRESDPSEPATAEITLSKAREILHDPECSDQNQDVLWRVLIDKTRLEDETWQLSVIWVALPGLRKIADMLRRKYRIDTEDVDAEVLATFTEVLRTEESPSTGGIGSHLWRVTRRRAERSLKTRQRETPVEDIELVGAFQKGEHPEEVISEAVEVEHAANEQVTASSEVQVEGERIGGIAQRLGLYGRLAGSECNISRQVADRSIPRSEEAAEPIRTRVHGSHGTDQVTGALTNSGPITHRTAEESKARRGSGVVPVSFPELFELPTVTDLTTAANAVGVSINTAYKLVHEGRFPCPVMRPGFHYKVPTRGLLRCLGIEDFPVYLSDVDNGASQAKRNEGRDGR